MLIDIHSHLNDERLEKNIPQILKNANEYGVQKIICVGCDINSSQKAIEIANTFDNVFACVGVHPEYCEDFDKKSYELINNMAKQNKVVGIGEIGLDYHYETHNQECQKQVFIKQLEIAYNNKLPIQIHSRDATKDTLDILNENKNLLKYGGIWHCYGGSVETLKLVQKLGLKVSIGGILTFKNARQTLDVAKVLPLDMLTFETDCPYLTPHPHRSETNEPKYVLLTAQKFAEIRNIPINEIEKISTQNVYDVFKKIKI